MKTKLFILSKISNGNKLSNDKCSNNKLSNAPLLNKPINVIESHYSNHEKSKNLRNYQDV